MKRIISIATLVALISTSVAPVQAEISRAQAERRLFYILIGTIVTALAVTGIGEAQEAGVTFKQFLGKEKLKNRAQYKADDHCKAGLLASSFFFIPLIGTAIYKYFSK